VSAPGRIYLTRPGTKKKFGPVHASSLVYFGDNPKKFARVFSTIGHIHHPGDRCEMCSAPMHGRKDKLYCSSACRQKAYRQRQAG